MKLNASTIAAQRVGYSCKADPLAAGSFQRDAWIEFHGRLRDTGSLQRTALPASSELGGTGMAPLDPFQDDFPSAAELEQANSAPVDGKDLPSGIVSPPLSPFYYSGEVGVFYGRSSGKFEREIMETYFLGTIGNDKFQITVGGAYGESNVNAPRYRSFKGSK